MVSNKALSTHAFVCQDTSHMPADMNIKPAVSHKSTCIHIHTHAYPAPPPTPNTHTHYTTGTTHTLVLIWNIVGGAGPVEGSVNSSGATPPFERPKFPFLRSTAWAGSAVQQAFSRHGRPQRPRRQHFTGTTAWHGWPDGPPHTSRWHTEPSHTHLVRAYAACTSASRPAFTPHLLVYTCTYERVCMCTVTETHSWWVFYATHIMHINCATIFCHRHCQEERQWVGGWEDVCGACLCLWFVSVCVGGD